MNRREFLGAAGAGLLAAHSVAAGEGELLYNGIRLPSPGL